MVQVTYHGFSRGLNANLAHIIMNMSMYHGTVTRRKTIIELQERTPSFEDNTHESSRKKTKRLRQRLLKASDCTLKLMNC